MSKKPDLPKKKMGRPPLLQLKPELIEKILGYIQDGAYIDTAFQACGISKDNYWKWQDRAEHGDPLLASFFRDLKKAEAEAEIEAMKKMRTITNWIPHATYLERRHRDKWGRSDRHQIDQNVNIRIETVDYNQLLKTMNRKKKSAEIDVTNKD